jgi:hypothetical protein
LKIVRAGSPIDVLRTNIIDKDVWKFSVLSRIDEIFETDPGESMQAWGYEYIDYVDEILDEMSRSTVYEELDNAIDELREISDFLEADLSDSISRLTAWRDALPSDDDEDYESYASESDSGSSRELDKVFRSLLQ